MHVIATAGHVDHGKSSLVRALTGTDPDRLEEEHRRGLSIQLGYAWTRLPRVGEVAFVDVPGHERFISTMLAGVGPVPAALLVVAADDPWMPQAAEHLAALDALGVRRGVVALTRSDLADPGPALARAAAETGRTSLRDAPLVAVSSRTGTGLDDLRAHLIAMVEALPEPPADADVRLWVDRRFTISGAGTVVTGTLPAGTIRTGDVLSLGPRSADPGDSGRPTVSGERGGSVRVRGVQTLGDPVDSASGVARVALNLTGDVEGLDRDSVLLTPEAFLLSQVVDVRVTGEVERLPTHPILHVGASSTSIRCRSLADDLVRLTSGRPLPLRVGDRALLRDPGSRRVWGVRVLDPLPPPLRRRGAAADRARVLAPLTGEPDLTAEVQRRDVVDADTLRRIGVSPTSPAPTSPGSTSAWVATGRWLVSAERAERAAREVLAAVREHDRSHPLDRGIAPGVLAERVGLPAPELVTAVVRPPLHVAGGRVLETGTDELPADVEQVLRLLAEDLTASPFAAPTAGRLAELGLDTRREAAAARAGRLLRLAPGIVLLPGADRLAVARLGELPQPFTASEARSRLSTSRRVVLPLLDHLDRAGLTRRLPDDRREVVDRSG